MLKTGLIAFFVAGAVLFGLSEAIKAGQPQNEVREQVNWFNRVSSIPLRG